MKKNILTMILIITVTIQDITAQYGIEQLIAHPEHYLMHKRFGIICNRASIDAYKRFLPDVLYHWATSTKSAQLTALFSPEHGLFMNQEAAAFVATNTTSPWHCPIYSLHGATKKPTAAMLKNIDTLIFDLPDVGVRCFTYLSTLKLTLQAAAEHGIDLIVLDRPNPIAMWGKTGPELAYEYESFVGTIQVPFLHGMTIGELAQFCNKDIGASLTILGSCKTMTVQPTDFMPPSPNLMSMEHVYAYPITVFLEGTNYSEGRGTALPFLQIGAPWVNALHLAEELNAYHWNGIQCVPTTFTPISLPGVAQHPKHENIECHGIRLLITEPAAMQPMVIAFELLKTLFKLYPCESKFIAWGDQYGIDLLVGNNTWRTTIMNPQKT